MNIKSIILLLSICCLSACKEELIEVPVNSDVCDLIENTHPNTEAFQAIIDQYAAKGIVGLSAYIHQPDLGDWNGAMGYAEIENQLEMKPCQLGYAASIIKTCIATIILQLEEEGKLSLDDPLIGYFDQSLLDKLPNGNTATIQHLLLNRSGMQDVFEVDFLLDFFNKPTQQYTMTGLLEYVYHQDPVAAAGEKFYYSDANFILLSMIIEQLEGDLRTVYQSRIFDKANMLNAHLIDDPEQVPTNGISASYWDRFGNGQMENVSDYQLALAAGLAGTDGLILSTEDLTKFAHGLMNGNFISETSYQKMIDCLDIPEADQNQNYVGYGLGIGQVKVNEVTWIGSFGNHVGSGAMVIFNPVDGTVVSILQNTGTFFNDPIKQTFFYELIYELEEVVY